MDLGLVEKMFMRMKVALTEVTALLEEGGENRRITGLYG